MRPIVRIILYASLLTACESGPINDQCPDPVGSDEYAVGDQGWICFQEDINGCFRLELDGEQPILRSVYVEGHMYGMIADYGEVTCLSAMRRGPQLDFHYAVYAKLRHGYVVRFPDETFGRLYIDSYYTNGSTITQVNFKRHYSF